MLRVYLGRNISIRHLTFHHFQRLLVSLLQQYHKKNVGVPLKPSSSSTLKSCYLNRSLIIKGSTQMMLNKENNNGNYWVLPSTVIEFTNYFT